MNRTAMSTVDCSRACSVRKSSFMEWLEVKVFLKEVPEDWSYLISVLHDLGCPNSRIVDDPPQMIGCFPDLPGVQNSIEELRLKSEPVGCERIETSRIADQDWVEVFRAHFKRKEIGDRLVIVPSWDKDEVENVRIPIYLDPGQAFGTGDHPTTQMCLELLQQLDVKGKNVADIGCGSGILGIAALKLGANQVTGFDIEEASVVVANENAAKNDVKVQFFQGDHPTCLQSQAPFDIIFSNIISATLINFSRHIPPLLASGGCWITSGVIPDNFPEVSHAAEQCGFVLQTYREQDGWTAAIFQLK